MLIHKNSRFACVLFLVQVSQTPNQRKTTFIPLCRKCLMPDMAPKGALIEACC